MKFFKNGTHEYDVEKKVCFTTPSETSHTRRVSVWRDALAYTLVFEVSINSRQSKFMSCKCHCDIYEYMNLIYKYLTSQKSKYPRFYQFTLKNVNLCNFESTELKVPDKDWSMLSGYGLVLIRCRHRRTHVKTMCTPGHVIIEIKAISKWTYIFLVIPLAHYTTLLYASYGKETIYITILDLIVYFDKLHVTKNGVSHTTLRLLIKWRLSIFSTLINIIMFQHKQI